MRILILGGDGKLGHQLLKSWQSTHDIHVTLRKNLAAYEAFGLFHAGNSSPEIDVRDLAGIASVMKAFQPEAVVNAVGIVKQRAESHARGRLRTRRAWFPPGCRCRCGKNLPRLQVLASPANRSWLRDADAFQRYTCLKATSR